MSETSDIFKAQIMRFIKVDKCFTLNLHDLISIRLVTRLRLDFNQLNAFKFRHNFWDTMSPMCGCGSEAESKEHFLRKK